MERVVGPSFGTRVFGLGGGVAKQPRTRGPSRADPTNAALEEELATLKENQKQLEERIQQQERDRQDREREQQERERERLEWEARIQAQLAEMARRMTMGAPPSDGSNAYLF
ncbi:hypothetical protein LguiB_020652 [Lonicera macranthoides]